MTDQNLNELSSGWVDTINEAGELQVQVVETEGNLQIERINDVGSEAESWAIGNITERPEGSAKYWAEAVNYSNIVTNDLRNISLTTTTANLQNGTYTMNVVNNTVFVLPTPVLDKYNQIEVFIEMNTVQTINFGTNVAAYNGEFPNMSIAGNYHLIWTYDPNIDKWVVGGQRVE